MIQRPLIILFVLLIGAGGATARAAEVIPPKPPRYFNDYANVTNRATADRLNQQLADFERQTTNQILVVVYPKMQSDSSIEDYTQRVAQKWGVGQKGRNNGAILFVFAGDRKMYIQVGYGLEGALPDALAKQIIEREIKPRFRQNDYTGGLSAAVTAMMGATKGEYKAMPQRTRGRPRVGSRKGMGSALIWIIVIMVILFLFRGRGGPGGYSRYGRHRRRGPGFIFFPTGGGWGGGGGGGGFSSGGGSFGGGGAGGSW